ncbi:hypothetical protein [Spirosoma koreense]
MDYFGCLYYPNPATGSNNNLVTYTNGGGNVFTISSDGGINNSAINANYITYNTGNEPTVSITDALKCFAVGTNTSDFNYSITVYVQEPYPGSGKSISYGGNPGHVWIGFQKQNKQTGVTSSSSVGLYPNSYGPQTVRSGVPSAIMENSTTQATVSIIYAVNSSQFDQAVTSAINNSRRSYSLENYNCTDYVNSIMSDTGLTIPKPVSYIVVFYPLPYNNTDVFTIHSPGALGKILRNMNSNAVKTGQNPPQRSTNCN